MTGLRSGEESTRISTGVRTGTRRRSRRAAEEGEVVTAMRVLVADPATIFRTGVRNLLRRESDFEVVEASIYEEAELRLERVVRRSR